MIQYKKYFDKIPTLGRGMERQVSVLTKNLKGDFEIDILVKTWIQELKYEYFANIININHRAGSIFYKIFLSTLKTLFCFQPEI